MSSYNRRLGALALVGIAACGSPTSAERPPEHTGAGGERSEIAQSADPTGTVTAREELEYGAEPAEVRAVRSAAFLAVSGAFQSAHAPREDNAECPAPPALPRTPSVVPCTSQPWAPEPGTAWAAYDLDLETLRGSIEMRATGARTALLRVYTRETCGDDHIVVWEWEMSVDSDCYLPMTPVTYRWTTTDPAP